MSLLAPRDLENLLNPLQEYYGQENTKAAMHSLIQFYEEEAFDNEDLTNDWIPDDFENSHGIDKFVKSLNYDALLGPLNQTNKRNLYDWFCHWLLQNVPKPSHPPIHPNRANVAQTAGGPLPGNDIPIDPIHKVANMFARQLRIHIAQFQISENNPNYQISRQITDNIARSFVEISKEDGYTELSHLNSDFENIEDSFIMDQLFKKYPQSKSVKQKMFNIVQNIVLMLLYDNYPPFSLKQFRYKVSKQTFNWAKEQCVSNIESIIKNKEVQHVHSNRPSVSSTEDQKDLELMNAKALDFENGFPLLINMSDAFARFRAEENRCLWRHNDIAPTDPQHKNSRHRSCTMKPKVWFEEHCGFAKFIHKQNPNSFRCMSSALTSNAKRAVPKMDLNHITDATIFDSYDIFARYLCAMNQFIFEMIAPDRHRGAIVPFQMDLWLIPRLTKNGIHHNFRLPADFNDVKMDDDEVDDDNSLAELLSGKIQALGKSLSASAKIWNLADNLKEDGYKKSEDFWVYTPKVDENVGNININDNFQLNRLVRNFDALWELFTDNKSVDMRYKRFIIIIDRRNPQHIKNKVMTDDTHKDQTWPDRMYLIRPKCKNEISKLYAFLMNETFICNTMDFLFPMPKLRRKDYRNDFRGLDSGNGYKFVVSYHVYFSNKVKMYWYFRQGVTRFFMDDINWLWPRYFKLEKDAFQILTDETKYALGDAMERYTLEDKQFNQFTEELATFDVFNKLKI